MKLSSGIYEQIVNKELKDELDKIKDDFKYLSKINKAETTSILSEYISKITKKLLESIKGKDEEEKQGKQVEFANKIIEYICKDDDFYSKRASLDSNGVELLSLIENDQVLKGDVKASSLIRPETSLVKSSLFTNSNNNEPTFVSELQKEIASSDEICFVVSFIKFSGLIKISKQLKEFTDKGKSLNIITTTYMGATDFKAIDKLSTLKNTTIQISYDCKHTRLHAKAYIFKRKTGFSTAYVGSSNLSKDAITTGSEWNIKVSAKELPELYSKIVATFDSYSNSELFEKYKPDDNEKLESALAKEKLIYQNNKSKTEDPNISSIKNSLCEFKPFYYQKAILDKLQAERKINKRNKNLVVAATGTGKTLISAFDYKRFREENPESCRLLFIAHRQEILEQSLDSFRNVLNDSNFGELWVGNYEPKKKEDLFISIQTANSQKITNKFSEDYFDFIIIDEVHHAAAKSYKSIFDWFKPKILLGLTATPERMDGLSILDYFDNRIAASIRLPEAIDRNLLCPFSYYGISDEVSLKDVKWSKGGYDETELNVIYIEGDNAKKRVEHIISSLNNYLNDVNEVHGIGFCVSIDHAKFMSRMFNENKIPSIALSSDSKDDDRATAKEKLEDGSIKFIFVVDLYNEGVDIPCIDTVMFLRPTKSLTVFLQQLGRGLRLYEGKTELTVLDFVGQANKHYNFEEKFNALLGEHKGSVCDSIKKGFPWVPAGCYIGLEEKAKEWVLTNIKESYSGRKSIVEKLKSFNEDTGKELSLSNFFEYSNIEFSKLYRGKDWNFSRLCSEAGLYQLNCECDDYEKSINNSLKKFTWFNSDKFIDYIVGLLSENKSMPEISSLSEESQKLVDMFYVTLFNKFIEFDEQDYNEKGILKNNVDSIANVKDNLSELFKREYLKQEIIELLEYRRTKIDLFSPEIDLDYESPLQLYCSYSRDQILASFKSHKLLKEGVVYLKQYKTDILLVTLSKTEKEYSEKTMYNDYSISDRLFHWQSQNQTSQDSKTGKRYINQKSRNNNILLFVREFKEDSLGTQPYTFLGKAEYVEHSGNKPMSVIWKLEQPIPAKFIKKTSKMLAM